MNSKSSWKETVSLYIRAIENPKVSPESKELAKSELLRLAEFADTYNQLIRLTKQ